MDRLLEPLARYAHPILLLVAGLLAIGATLTVMGLPLIGWSTYAVGHLGLLVALPALVAVYRAGMDWFAWLTFAILYVGVVAGAAVALAVWGFYAADSGGAGAMMPSEVTPWGMLAGVVTWVGLGLFGVATYRTRVVPRGGSIMFALAAIVGLLAEFGYLTVFGWGIAIFIASLALVWLAPNAEPEAAAV